MRILHVADFHLDRAFGGLAFTGCDGSRRRQLLRRALEWTADLALERRPDLLTIGGDLFEQERVTSDTVAFVARQLRRVACRVLLASGNHDFAGPTSPYRTTAWPPNVTLRLAPHLEPLELGDGVVWAFGYGGPELVPGVLADWRAPDDGRTHLLLGHGVDVSVSSPEPGRLGLSPDDVQRAGFHHVLLGHIHAGHVGELLSSPGSPVPLDPSEVVGSHGALWIETEGRTVRVETLPLRLCGFATLSMDLSGVGDSSELEEKLRRRLRELPDRDTTLVSCRLHGRRPRPLLVDPELLAAGLHPEVLGLSVVDVSEPEIDLAELAREPNARGKAVERLLAEGSDVSVKAAELVALSFEGDLRLPA